MLTYEQIVAGVIADASNMMRRPKKPSLRLALMVAAVSALQPLERNARLARVLRKYALKPFPDRESLYQELREQRAVLFSQHIDALYRIEHHSEFISSIEDEWIRSSSIEEQRLVREKIIARIGIGRKIASFALFLYNPYHCQVVPIDRHQLARYCFLSRCISDRKQYEMIEDVIVYERDNCSYTIARSLSVSMFAWTQWEYYRQYNHISKLYDCIESHADLSACEY